LAADGVNLQQMRKVFFKEEKQVTVRLQIVGLGGFNKAIEESAGPQLPAQS